MILKDYIEQARRWSYSTFGPGPRTNGVLQHIEKEIKEIRESPYDLEEWIDIVILALDGAWRTGAPSDVIESAFEHKFAENLRRAWPDWRNGSQDEAIEHIRSFPNDWQTCEHEYRMGDDWCIKCHTRPGSRIQDAADNLNRVGPGLE